MKSNYTFCVTLKKMMNTKSILDISVSSLCEEAKLNRKTFYYHYHDIYDLLVQVYLNEKMANIQQVNNIKDLIDTIYKYYEDNKGFVDSSISSIGKDLFLEFITNNCYTTFLRMINSIDTKTVLSISEKRNVAMFYSGAFSHTMVYYILTHQTKLKAQFVKCFEIINDDDFKLSIDKLILKKLEETR